MQVEDMKNRKLSYGISCLQIFSGHEILILEALSVEGIRYSDQEKLFLKYCGYRNHLNFI